MGSVVVPNALASLIKDSRRRGLFAVLALYCLGAWIALQIADLLFPGWNIPAASIRYVWIGTFLLFPIAIVVGWRYEITQRGLLRTSSSIAAQSEVPLERTDYWLLSGLAAVAGMISLGVVYEVVASRMPAESADYQLAIPEHSIAVLPFVNMSDDPANEYFGDGITEQLLNELSGVSGLHVAARTSSFYYKNKNEQMQKMGAALGVRTLLEGSVRKAGNRIRITAQLINASDGYHLWSETWERELNDIFFIQDEISRAIVNTLKIELMQTDDERLDRSVTDNVEAYDLYLRAMSTRLAFSQDSLEKSQGMFAQVIELDPEFALAYDALAYGYLLMPYSAKMNTDEAIEHAEPLLATALELQPDLEEAHASLGLMRSMTNRFEEANEHYEVAIAINPNYFGGHVNYGLSLVHQGRLKDAASSYLKAQALDPLNANLTFNLGSQLMLMGQFDDGLEFIEKSFELDPGRVLTKGAITHWLTVYGHLVEAVEIGHEVVAAFPDYAQGRAALIRAYVNLGMLEDAESLLVHAQEFLHDNHSINEAANAMLLRTGDYDALNEFASQGFERLDTSVGDPLNLGQARAIREYGRSLLRQGRNEAAAEVLHWGAGGEDGIAKTTYDYMISLKLLALSYKRLDRQEEANILINQCLELTEAAHENGWATPNLFYRLAEIYAIKGDVSNAAANLETAFERGWRDIGILEYGIFWEDLQDDPAINSVKVEIYNDLEAQKRTLLEKSIETADRSVLGNKADLTGQIVSEEAW